LEKFVKQDFEEISSRRRKNTDPEMLARVEAQVEADFAILQIAIEVKRARRAAQLTQIQLASRTGITQSEISRIEKGRYSPRLSTLFMLAQALKTDFVIPGSKDQSIKVA
jgi:DNA-binding XRE family transcriptional regulator